MTLLLFTLLASPVCAQQAGQIVGTIRDTSGLAVPGVSVVATEAATNFKQSTTTGSEGEYVLTNLRPTTYTVSATAKGFRTFQQNAVELQANQSLTLNLVMQVGQVTETVEVTSAVPQVDTSTSTLSEVIGTERIAELPLNGRDAARLSTLVAGTVMAGVSSEAGKAIPGGLYISSNGTGPGQVSYWLDGVTNTDFYFQLNMEFPFPDALQEFSIQTSNYSAMFGNNAGAVVNAVTKSGTNNYHGGAFEFVRNRVFNASDYFAPAPDFLKRNQFGAYLGGPVRIPKVYNGQNKTFFFIGWQGTRLRNVNTAQNAFVPTNDELSGNFATCGKSCGKPIKDPATGLPFPGNQISPRRFDHVALNFINQLLPRATGTGFVTYQKAISQNLDQGIAHVDHQLTANDRLSARYFIDQFQNQASYNPSDYLSYADGSGARTQNLALSELHIFGPNLLNDFHFGFTREFVKRGPPAGVPDWHDLGMIINQQLAAKMIQTVSVSGFFSAGDFPQGAFVRNGYEFDDHANWVHGRHSVGIGVEYDQQQVIIRNTNLRGGTASFSGNVTGNAMADFLLGQVGTFSQGSGEYRDARGYFPAFWVQDDFKVSSRLTLNLGIRYEPNWPWFEIKNRYEVFSPSGFAAGVRSVTFPLAPPGEYFYGDPGIPYGGQYGDFNNVGPRVGFAWDVFGDGKTSLRGGGGMFYDQHGRGDAANGSVSKAPFSPQLNLIQPAGGLSNPYLGLTDPFPAAPPSPTSVFPSPVVMATLNTHLITPITYNWNLTVERQLAKDWTFRTAYVGTHASHQRRNAELDPAVYSPGATTATTNARRLYAPYFANIPQLNYDGNSTYHSLQLSLLKRLSHGFTIMSNYTYSRSIDDIGTGLAGNVGQGDEVVPYYMRDHNLYLRGPSDFDHTHRLVNSYVWEIPGGERTNRFLSRVVGGWELTGIQQFQTGSPMTVVSGIDNSRTALGADRAVSTGLPYARPASANSVAEFFNTAAFAVNPVGTFGNTGKGILRGPRLSTWDMGLYKNTQLTEAVNLQFRSEFFNVFNHPNFNNPSTSVSSASFGRITQTLANASTTFSGTASPGLNASAGDPGSGGPRIIQLGMKLIF